jgi:cytidine deaminase
VSAGADKDLIARAIAVQSKAYAPYSKFTVGAAIRIDGKTFEGANVENASYGLAICAERSAIFTAVVAGARNLEAVAVCTNSSPPSSPCGACRQVLLEFAADPSKVTITAVNPAGEHRSWTLAQLIPDGFSGRELP